MPNFKNGNICPGRQPVTWENTGQWLQVRMSQKGVCSVCGYNGRTTAGGRLRKHTSRIKENDLPQPERIEDLPWRNELVLKIIQQLGVTPQEKLKRVLRENFPNIDTGTVGDIVTTLTRQRLLEPVTDGKQITDSAKKLISNGGV